MFTPGLADARDTPWCDRPEVLALRGSTFSISTRANSTGTIWTAVGRTQWSWSRGIDGKQSFQRSFRTPFWSTRGLIDCTSFHTRYLEYNIYIYNYIIRINSLFVCFIHQIYQFLHPNESTSSWRMPGTTTTYRHLCNLYKTILNRRRVEPRGLLDQMCWVPRVSSSTGCDMWYVDHESGCMICTHSWCNDCYHIF